MSDDPKLQDVLPPDPNVSRLREASTPREEIGFRQPLSLRLTLASSITLDAWTFTLSELESGRGVGHALVCAQAHYATIAWRGVDALERRLVDLADWHLFTLAVQEGIPPTPLEREHVVSRILLTPQSRASIVIQYVSAFPVEVAPVLVPTQLDRLLRTLAPASVA